MYKKYTLEKKNPGTKNLFILIKNVFYLLRYLFCPLLKIMLELTILRSIECNDRYPLCH